MKEGDPSYLSLKLNIFLIILLGSLKGQESNESALPRSDILLFAETSKGLQNNQQFNKRMQKIGLKINEKRQTST